MVKNIEQINKYNMGNIPTTELLSNLEQPEFIRIIDSLRSEAVKRNELINILIGVTNTIKPIPPLPCEENKNKPSECVVDYFWAEILHMQSSNEQLERCVFHLKSIVGQL